MRRLALLVIIAVPAALYAQRPQSQQSARQALIEMFFSDSPLNIFKHLPEATKAALMKGGDAFTFGPASIGGDLKRQGKHFEVYEAGPVLVSSSDPRTEEKIEVAIDRDDLIGDQDEVEVSFHTFKNGQEQSLSTFFPRVSLKMGREAGVWKLREIAFNLRLPLDDPDFLKALQETFEQNRGTAGNPAVRSLYMLNFAESRYKTLHPERGFTCSLTELGTVGVGNNPSSQPVLESSLLSGSNDGYKFVLTGCGSQPVSTYQITAQPTEPGKRAFCMDQSGAIKYSADGQAATCLSSGQVFDGGSIPGRAVMLEVPTVPN